MYSIGRFDDMGGGGGLRISREPLSFCLPFIYKLTEHAYNTLLVIKRVYFLIRVNLKWTNICVCIDNKHSDNA